MARVQIHNEVTHDGGGGWTLCFQYCTYHYDDGSTEDGFRFIWRRPDDSLQAARGQARIPDEDTLYGLLNAAREDGWFE
jgi:hypothetical protein